MRTPLYRRAAVALFALLIPPGASAAMQPSPDPHFERLVLVQLNRVRTDPTGYAQYLATLRARFQPGGLCLRPGGSPIQTKEGVGALDEAIRALRNTPPLLQLAACEPLAQAAREFAAEQAHSGAVGHGGSPFRRLSRHGKWQQSAGENIAYGSTTPERVVADLIVDDGQPGRGHRANILNGAFRVAGVGMDRHPRFGTVCVIDFAGGFQSR